MDASIITSYFPDLNEKQVSQFEALGAIYEDWNSKINVISRKDIETLYERHVLHSLAIAQFIQFLPGSIILDVGTGGGFPGIPLAIFFPEAQFTLVDSIGKKIKVVTEIVQAIELSNVQAFQERAEKIKGTFDFVVTRAVARSRQLWNWSHDKIASEHNHPITNGIIALKGGDLDDELEELGRPYQRISLKQFFQEEFFETKEIVYIPQK